MRSLEQENMNDEGRRAEENFDGTMLHTTSAP